jgi:hypothetical protein
MARHAESFAHDVISGFDDMFGVFNVNVMFRPDAPPSQRSVDRIGARRESRREWDTLKFHMAETTEAVFDSLAWDLGLHPKQQVHSCWREAWGNKEIEQAA